MNKNRIALWMLGLAVSLLTVAPLSFAELCKPWPTSLDDLARAKVLKDGLFKSPDSIQKTSDVAASGAVGKCNLDFEAGHSAKFCVQNQRVGAELIEAGSRELGVKILNWGTQPKLVGESSKPYAGDGDRFHSVSFFAEALARAMLVLPGDQIAADEREAWRKILASASEYLASDQAPGESKQGGNWTHRDYVLAAALQEASEVLGVKPWSGLAEHYAREGLKRQLADGTNPERNTSTGNYGFDINYQSAGIIYASRFFVATTQADLKCEISAMVRKAATRLMSAVDPKTLEIDGSASTRTCHESSNNGVFKMPEEKSVVQALAYAGLVTADDRFTNFAAKISERMEWASGHPRAHLGHCGHK